MRLHVPSTVTTTLSDPTGSHWIVSLHGKLADQFISQRQFHTQIPATLLSALSTALPNPNLKHNNLHPVYEALENTACTFQTTLPPLDPSQPTILFLPSIQFPAEIKLNSHILLSSTNAFHPHALILPSKLLANNENLLAIHFPSVQSALSIRADTHSYREWNDPLGGISTLRVPQYLAGWDWAPRQLSPGIPLPISLLHIPHAALCDVACQQHIQTHPNVQARLHIIVHLISNHSSQSTPQLRCILLPDHVHHTFAQAHHTVHSAYNSLLLGNHAVLNCVQQQYRHLVQLIDLEIAPPQTNAHRSDDAHDNSPHPPHATHRFHMWDHFSALDIPEMVAYRYHAHAHVTQPQLWWPNGMGQQNLYHLHVAICASTTLSAQQHSDVVLDQRTLTIGLRKLELIRDPAPQKTYLDPPSDDDDVHPVSCTEEHPAQDSTEGPPSEPECESNSFESFTFCVNDRTFFAKGANYIPSLMQYHRTTVEQYEQTIQSACQANMNMLRVWGGGIYEQDAFYELCNRHGILLWHDFMFSCALYPGDEQFLQSCRREAQYQVSRLRNHPCMALWCGNNELEQVPHDILKTEPTKLAYETLFYKILPNVMDSDPGQIPYWPSSPHNPFGYEKGFNDPRGGDTHFWDVWHARKPVSSYLNHRSRFCSEFGMQSYLSEAGARALAGYEPGALNPFGPIMEAHQKNANGNLIILEYCQRLFRAPKDYSSLSYQSQLNQMICMQTGVEHFRRSWPYCAGALYWQLNDCWPCFSWSSIEFGGNWKALHHGAKRFFAPLLVSVIHHGEESVGVCNLLSFNSETGLFSIYATFDGEEEQISVTLSWSLVNVRTNESTLTGTDKLVLKQDTSRKIATVDVREKDGTERNPRHYVLRVDLSSSSERYHSMTTSWLCSPRHCDLPNPELTLSVESFDAKTGLCQASLRIESSCFAPFVEIFLKPAKSDLCEGDASEPSVYVTPTRYTLSDNFFDIFAGEAKLVELIVFEDIVEKDFLSRIAYRTLLDTYMT